MYSHFLRFQIQQSRRKYDGEYTPDVSWDKDAILSLGKLAFQQLQKNNVIFYDADLEACGIDVYKASVYSGMCTQIFKKESGINVGTMYCFVHLSIQEFIAALYAHLCLDINKKSVFVQDLHRTENRNKTMIDLLKTAVDKALESENGHLDLFLRFLLGLSLQSNRQLLRGLLTQQDRNDQSNKEIVQYIKQKFEADLSPERSINLFYCLNDWTIKLWWKRFRPTSAKEVYHLLTFTCPVVCFDLCVVDLRGGAGGVWASEIQEEIRRVSH